MQLRLVFISLLLVVGCGQPEPPVSGGDGTPPVSSPRKGGLGEPRTLAPNEGVLTIVGTNDVHGAFESEGGKGGAFLLSGFVAAIRQFSASSYAEKGKVLLLDAGDSFQGTLLSDLSEGMVAAAVMNELGYTAAIAGNHGFDFGPVDPKLNTCEVKDCDPLGALKEVVKSSKFPWLGTNVHNKEGEVAAPFRESEIVPFMGRNIAILGYEGDTTPVTAVPANVKALRFQKLDTLPKLIETLSTRNVADIFVVIAHMGDDDSKEFLASLNRIFPAGFSGPMPAAIIAGHTHRKNQEVTDAGIPYVQSGANGQAFGVIELPIFKGADGRLSVHREEVDLQAAISIDGRESFWNIELAPLRNVKIDTLLKNEREKIAPIAERRVTKLSAPLSHAGGREHDTPVGNFLTSVLQKATGAQVAIINNGSVRSDLADGNVKTGLTIRFENLFRVLPSNDQVLVVQAMSVDVLARNFKRAVRSCGLRGVLEVTGLHPVYSKPPDCGGANEDLTTKLLRLVLDDGKVIWEDKRNHGEPGDQLRKGVSCKDQELPCPECVLVPTVSVALTDFLIQGGAGYCHFRSQEGAATRVGEIKDEIMRVLDPASTVDVKPFLAGRYQNIQAKAPGGSLQSTGLPQDSREFCRASEL
jgi:5'-nucleotidase